MKDKVIALDIGGTYMRCAIVKRGKIISYEKISTPKNKKLFLKKLVELIKNFDSKEIKGIGIGIAGPIKNGVVKNPPNLPIKNFDLKKYLSKKFKKIIEIKNDAVCSSLAELKFGCKKNNFILITIGTGIGGGIIINGKEYSGQGYAGELGHIYLGEKDWENLWKKTRKKIKKIYGRNILISELIKINDIQSKKFLDEIIDYIAKGIVSLINIFDPEVVIIGGGVSKSGNKFLNLIKNKVEKYSFFDKKTPISYSKLEHSGIIGANLLIN